MAQLVPCVPCQTQSISSGKFMLNVHERNCADHPSASHDILRLYDLREQDGSRTSAVPYLIIPGHRTGVVSQLYLDPTCSYMISTGGNRGWEGTNTEVLLGYEIGIGT